MKNYLGEINELDWERIECNFGYYNYLYNSICKSKSKTIVILSGFWSGLLVYPKLIKYFKDKYGQNCIFDFYYIDEVYRFCDFLKVQLTCQQKEQINEKWNCLKNHFDKIKRSKTLS